MYAKILIVMTILHTQQLNKYLGLFFLLTFFIINTGISQENEPVENIKTEKPSETISFDNISNETERLSQRIINLREILSPSTKISLVDSTLQSIVSVIHDRKDSLIPLLKKMNKRELSALNIEWSGYKSELKDYQSITNERSEEVGKINDELVKEIKRWEETKEELKKNSKSNDVYTSLDEMISTLQKMIEVAHTRLDDIFVVQKGITEIVLEIDDVLLQIEEYQIQLQRDYFIFDSRPIWEKEPIDSLVVTNENIASVDENSSPKLNLDENIKQIKEFYSVNAKTAVLQVAFILLIFSLFFIMRRRRNDDQYDFDNNIERQANIILSHPIAASLVIGPLISAFFYGGLIPIIGGIHVLLIFTSTVYLLPKLTNKKFILFLVLLYLIYIEQFLELYLGINYIGRWMVILKGSILLYTLIVGIRTVRKSPEKFTRIVRFIKSVLPFFVFLSGIAIVANIIGMTGLSVFLIEAVMFSTILGLVVYLAVKVITSITILILRLRQSYNLKTISSMLRATNDRIQPILYWMAFFVWIYFTLQAFEIYRFLVNWINETLIIQWEIGEMTISLGGILAFVSIFVVTMVFSKLVSAIFQDEWMVNVLPRGAAPAVSLLLRIAIVSIGLYVGLSAAGLDLSELGFVLGALGVGIGFGLQNVVLNFISGLILAFERPINIGDAIQIDQEFGVVTNIGVRSSNIRTWGGQEAIIPNGDLISKKVINWTLNNRDRRSKLLIRTLAGVDPLEIIDILNTIADKHEKTYNDPKPKTYFKGYQDDGNLLFQLLYWSTFSDTLKIDHDINLEIFKKLRESGLEAPAPVRRIIKDE